MKKDVLKNFSNFTGEQLCQSLFLDRVVNLKPASLSKQDCGTGAFL